MTPENRSPLAAPLWLVGLGLIVIGGGIFYLAHVLSEKRREAEARKAEAVVAALKTNAPPTTGVKPVLSGWSRVRSNPRQVSPPPVPVPETVIPVPEPASSASVINEVPAPKKPDFFGFAGNAGTDGKTSLQEGPRIAGIVKLKGTPPSEKPLPLDPNCGRLYSANPPTTQFYAVNDGRLADVVVFISAGLEGRAFPIPTEPIGINQRGCVYEPYVTAAFAGQRILVRNSDPLLHNVHPTPAVAGNPESNKAQLPNGADLEFNFTQPEMFLRFKCDVHPWMFCYVSVFDHPFYAVTDENGAFVMPAPPPGKYLITAVHRKAGSHTRDIQFRANEKWTITFEMPVLSAGKQ